MIQSTYDLIIVGSGITGLTAAKEAAQRGLRTACIESLLFGGLIVNINELDGIETGEPTSGISLATGLMSEVVDLGVENINETVTAIRCEGSTLRVFAESGEYRGKSLIVASGAQMRRLDVPGEADFEHKGVSHCADCDGPMYKGKDVVVVGGGDSALQEALVLAGYCGRVYLLVRGSAFRAREHLASAVLLRNNIHVMWTTVVEEVVGSQAVEGVRIRCMIDGKKSNLRCAGVFPFVGLQPNVSFVPLEIPRATDDTLVTDSALQTSVPGVFAAGIVRSGNGGLLSDAASDARLAVSSVAAWLNHMSS